MAGAGEEEEEADSFICADGYLSGGRRWERVVARVGGQGRGRRS